VRAISLALPFFGFNRPDAKVSQGTIDWFWLAGMQVSIKALTIASDNLCGRAARHVHDACGSGDCGLAGIPAIVKHG
jgi:hypothetical protein